jgi:hypothetical protein
MIYFQRVNPWNLSFIPEAALYKRNRIALTNVPRTRLPDSHRDLVLMNQCCKKNKAALYKRNRIALTNVPRTRLELAQPKTATRPSTWRVYQFHHLGINQRTNINPLFWKRIFRGFSGI